jgi:hypothetical protein
MGFKKFSKDEMRQHFNRWIEIEDKLPVGYVNKVMKINPDLSPNKIMNVAYGRSQDFEILELLEEVVKASKSSFLKRHSLRAH